MISLKWLFWRLLLTDLYGFLILRVETLTIDKRLLDRSLCLDNPSDEQKEEFLQEIEKMKQLGSHQNVVSLVGCCTMYEKKFLVIEYVPFGDLLQWLRRGRTSVGRSCPNPPSLGRTSIWKSQGCSSGNSSQAPEGDHACQLGVARTIGLITSRCSGKEARVSWPDSRKQRKSSLKKEMRVFFTVISSSPSCRLLFEQK